MKSGSTTAIFFFMFAVMLNAQLKVNEIMYAPAGNEPEWLEIINNSPSDFSGSLIITNQNSSIRIDNLSLPAGKFIVVCSDTNRLKLNRSIPETAILTQAKLVSLHNSFDPITLRSADFSLIDSAYYEGDWGKKGFSLERKSLLKEATYKGNFFISLSVNGATAGMENSYSLISPPNEIQKGKVIINEVLYDEGDSSAEFVELFNASDEDIPLFECFISNKPTSTGHDTIVISKPKYAVSSGSYFLIVWDSLIFTQFPFLKDRNDVYFAESNLSLKVSDGIQLSDCKGNILDKLEYFDFWRINDLDGRKNISLEKISASANSGDRSSWAFCGIPAGATPLSKNSVSEDSKHKIEINASPNPFSNKNGKQGKTVISYKLPFKSSRIRAYIWTESGQEVCRIIENKYTSPIGEIEWDGKDNTSQDLAPGPYILWFEAVDILSGEPANSKLLLVIGS